MQNKHISMKNGAKMGSGAHSWEKVPLGEQNAPNHKKGQPIWEVILETLGHLFGGHCLMYFLKAFFSVFGRLWGAQGDQKAPNMEPTWSQKDA